MESGPFSATLTTAGSRTVTATDVVNGSISGVASISALAAAATHFLTSAPGSATAGSPATFTVTALDAYNNTATGYSGVVRFSSTDPAAVLPGNSSLSNGQGTFSVTLKTAGSRTVTATDNVSSTITGASGTINVSAASAARFVVTAPSSTTAGGTISITVTAQDIYNNTATGYSGTVHFTSSDAAAALPSNATLTSGTGNVQRDPENGRQSIGDGHGHVERLSERH